MNFLEFFKYFSLISLPLFLIIALSLIKKVPEFSFKKHTISKTILFLTDPIHIHIFRLNFILKTLLDLGFVWYLLNHFKINYNSPLSYLLISSTILFSFLAFFLVGKHTFVHRVVIYGYGVLWAIAQIILAQMTGNSIFIIFTNFLSIGAVTIAFGFLFAKKTNVFVQIFCVVMFYAWSILYVFRYL